MSTLTFKQSLCEPPSEPPQHDELTKPGLLPWQAISKAEWEVQQQVTHAHDLGMEQSTHVWHTPPSYSPAEEKRLSEIERNEPKRRLIRDAKALCKLRRITQAQMAEEIGVPHRTLEDWLQFRRMPKAPGTTLLRRWVDKHIGSKSESHITN
jgi:DNA-binding transcriptional regulator YiaG